MSTDSSQDPVPYVTDDELERAVELAQQMNDAAQRLTENTNTRVALVAHLLSSSSVVFDTMEALEVRLDQAPKMLHKLELLHRRVDALKAREPKVSLLAGMSKSKASA